METNTRFGRGLAGLALAGVLGLIGLAGGSGCNKPTSLSVPMQFRPTNTLNTNAVSGRLPAAGTAKVYMAPVEDKRTEKQDLIGENLENDGKAVPVYAAD